MDLPLDEGNWPLLSSSTIPWSESNQQPKEMTRSDMDRVLQQFISSAKMADRAGFDMIEIHAAHGYLLSSFISPLINIRTDQYGGSKLENRMRFPLEVINSIRNIWPSHKPMSVRISAHDWVGDFGITPQDSVMIASILKDNNIDICDVSAGQTIKDDHPTYGRMFQTPFSDRIRNEAKIPTMAVGNIYEADHVNSILMAGRADLVCLGRPHLTNPYWTLTQASSLENYTQPWPKPYYPGRNQIWRLMKKNVK